MFGRGERLGVATSATVFLLSDGTDVDTVAGVFFFSRSDVPMTSFNWVSAALIMGREQWSCPC